MKQKFQWKHWRDKQDLTDAYRQYKDGVLYFNYQDKLVELHNPGEKSPALIYGTLFETLCELVNGKKECSFAEVWAKIQALEA